jgi:hypothetical protein
MKVDARPSEHKQAPVKGFHEQLHAAPKLPSAPKLPVAPKHAGLKTVPPSAAHAMQTVRAQAHVKAEGLVHARSQGLETDREHHHERAHALIERELQRDEEHSERRIAAPTVLTGTAALAPRPEATKVKASEAIALVQKIEVFLKSSRPSLSMTLTGRFAGEVQIERVGKGEVSLRLRPSGQKPSASELEELRGARAGRGLKLREVRFG